MSQWKTEQWHFWNVLILCHKCCNLYSDREFFVPLFGNCCSSRVLSPSTCHTPRKVRHQLCHRDRDRTRDEQQSVASGTVRLIWTGRFNVFRDVQRLLSSLYTSIRIWQRKCPGESRHSALPLTIPFSPALILERRYQVTIRACLFQGMILANVTGWINRPSVIYWTNEEAWDIHWICSH